MRLAFLHVVSEKTFEAFYMLLDWIEAVEINFQLNDGCVMLRYQYDRFQVILISVFGASFPVSSPIPIIQVNPVYYSFHS